MTRAVPRAAALALSAVLWVVPAAGGEVAGGRGAVLRGLDQGTGSRPGLKVANGDTVSFGSLSVTVSDCRYPVSDPTSNAYAHVTIYDPSQATPVFSGWMVATSPALSALDHPRYDIWVIRCISS